MIVQLHQTWLGGVLRQLAIAISPPASVAENLALDEASLLAAAAEQRSTLRLWWGNAPTVVLGNSENEDRVIDRAACERLGVVILRRPTGGGAVLQGPGVLNYSLTAPAPPTLDVQGAFLLGGLILIGAVAPLGIQAERRGISDVAIGDLKISGNAQTWRRKGLLLHGTLLYDLDIDLVEACLRHPPREPDYRRGRRHRDFMTTLRAQGVAVTPPEIEQLVVDSARRLAAGR